MLQVSLISLKNNEKVFMSSAAVVIGALRVKDGWLVVLGLTAL